MSTTGQCVDNERPWNAQPEYGSLQNRTHEQMNSQSLWQYTRALHKLKLDKTSSAKEAKWAKILPLSRKLYINDSFGERENEVPPGEWYCIYQQPPEQGRGKIRFLQGSDTVYQQYSRTVSMHRSRWSVEIELHNVSGFFSFLSHFPSVHWNNW